MENDGITAISYFWDSINHAFMGTLQTNKGLQDYKDLREKSHPKNVLIPASTDARYNESNQNYKYFSKTLHNHLMNPDIITKEKSPRAYNSLQAYCINTEGFDLLTKITFSLSPHLGGICTTCEDLVS